MRYYTRSGDRGDTSLLEGRRVPKDSLRVEAYGEVDELNSFLGLCRSKLGEERLKAMVERIQEGLFTLGADLAAPSTVKPRAPRMGSAWVEEVESMIEELSKDLRPLRSFVLPGENEVAALLHVCRSVARRAERRVVRLVREEGANPECLRYLNRLSSLFFVMARWINEREGLQEKEWHP